MSDALGRIWARQLRLVLAAPAAVKFLNLGSLNISVPGSTSATSLLVTTVVAAQKLGRHPTAAEERRLQLEGKLSPGLERGVLRPGTVLHGTVFLDAIRFPAKRAIVRLQAWDQDQHGWVVEQAWSPQASPVVLAPRSWERTTLDDEDTSGWSAYSGSWTGLLTRST